MEKIKAQNWLLEEGDEIDVIIRTSISDCCYSVYEAVITDVQRDDSDDYFKRAIIKFKYLHNLDEQWEESVTASWTEHNGERSALLDIVYYGGINHPANLGMNYIILPRGRGVDYVRQRLKEARKNAKYMRKACWKSKLFNTYHKEDSRVL